MLTVFSYWNGTVPQICDLHFRSFLFHGGPDVTYRLYLERGSGLDASLAWIQQEPRIQIEFISLKQELRRDGLDYLAHESSAAQRLISRVVGKCSKLLLRANENRESPARRPLGWELHPFRYVPRATALLGVPNLNPPMLADLFRVIYSTRIATDSLYVDVDTCFLRNPREFCNDHAFLYRWEHFHFGNSAVLYVPAGSPLKQGSMLQAVRQFGTPLPWVLFNDETCRELGLEIQPCSRFDPFWIENPLNVRDFEDFFRVSSKSSMITGFLGENCPVYHWHNNWKTVAEPGSPYDILLRRFSVTDR